MHSNKYSIRANNTNTSTNERCTVTRYNRMYRVNTMIQLVDSVVVPSLQLDQWCVLSGWQSARFSCWAMPVSTGFQTSFVCPVWILWLQSSLLPYCYFTDWENVESRVKSAGGWCVEEVGGRVQRGTSASDDMRQLTRRTTIRRRSVARSTPNVQSQVTVTAVAAHATSLLAHRMIIMPRSPRTEWFRGWRYQFLITLLHRVYSIESGPTAQAVCWQDNSYNVS